jgi:nucleotide-binding universal stress UspA family protein
MTTSTGSIPDPTPEATSRRRWIVGVDGSDCARHAALWAACNLTERADELELITTWSVPVSGGYPVFEPMVTTASIELIERSAHETVEQLANQLRPSVSVPITTIVGRGGAASILLEAAHHATLMIVGSRGRGGFSRLVLGSTSTQCATHSTIPTVVVPHLAPLDPVRNIVVAFDGSPNALAALHWALDFATPGTTIECVSVWDVSPITVGSDRYFFPEAVDLARDRFHHLVGDSMHDRDVTGIDVKRHFVEGRPREELVSRSANADLLVMGARGHGAIGATLLGSVSTSLLHHVQRTMVVVPHPVETEGASSPE